MSGLARVPIRHGWRAGQGWWRWVWAGGGDRGDGRAAVAPGGADARAGGALCRRDRRDGHRGAEPACPASGAGGGRACSSCRTDCWRRGCSCLRARRPRANARLALAVWPAYCRRAGAVPLGRPFKSARERLGEGPAARAPDVVIPQAQGPPVRLVEARSTRGSATSWARATAWKRSAPTAPSRRLPAPPPVMAAPVVAPPHRCARRPSRRRPSRRRPLRRQPVVQTPAASAPLAQPRLRHAVATVSVAPPCRSVARHRRLTGRRCGPCGAACRAFGADPPTMRLDTPVTPRCLATRGRAARPVRSAAGPGRGVGAAGDSP